MTPAQKTSVSANVRMTLSATGWAGCTAIWFIAMTAIAVLAGDKPTGIPALMAVFVGGIFILGGLGVLTLLSQSRGRRG